MPARKHAPDPHAIFHAKIKLILVEPYFDSKTPNSIGSQTGAKVVVMLPSVGGEKEVTDYFKLFDYDIALLMKAFQETN